MDPAQAVFMVRLGFHFIHDLQDITVFIDDKRVAENAHVLASHKLFQAPSTIGFGDRMIFIRQQGKV